MRAAAACPTWPAERAPVSDPSLPCGVLTGAGVPAAAVTWTPHLTALAWCDTALVRYGEALLREDVERGPGPVWRRLAAPAARVG